MNKETPEQEAERLYPNKYKNGEGGAKGRHYMDFEIADIQRSAHITAARMYMDTIDRLTRENDTMRKALEMIRDGFDHENDAHKYQNLGACPVCIATEALKTNTHG